MEGFGIRVFVFVVIEILLDTSVYANVVFQVQHKFPVDNRSLSAYQEHDSFRHRRILAGADLLIGGDSGPSSVALYYTKIRIGNPPKEYHVQVDTGSDVMWINCAGCVKCPQTSDLGVPLSLYDPQQSSNSRTVACEDDFCSTALDPSNNQCVFGSRCTYVVRYGDGSTTTGFLVKDNVQLNRISGDLQTTNMKGSIMFGCGMKQLGSLGETEQALDGILGFGQSNLSIVSQLASSKKVKKMFSHCLSGSKGGIFAIGEVVHPKVNSTPDMSHFSIELKAIQVGDEFVNLPTFMFNTAAKRGAIIDSGTTLAYFPEPVYSQLMKKIMAAQPNADINMSDHKFKCFAGKRNENVDDAGFPIVTFHFKNALKLKVYPHQYIFKTQHNHWCIGFLDNGPLPMEANAILLGDIVMIDRLVTYNMEDQSIGWTDYDCSSSIKVKDEESGKVYEVGAHDITWTASSGGSGRANVSVFVLLVFIIAAKIVIC